MEHLLPYIYQPHQKMHTYKYLLDVTISLAQRLNPSISSDGQNTNLFGNNNIGGFSSLTLCALPFT